MFENLLPLYTYCESSVGNFEQPLNFLSSVVFWLGAGWLLYKNNPEEGSPSYHQLAALLLFLQGLTSMFWHVGGGLNYLAADLIVLAFLFTIIVTVICDDILRFNLYESVFAIVGIIILSVLFRNQMETLLPQNGGVFIPLVFFFGVAALKVQTINEKATTYLLTAAYLFLFGIAARSTDSWLCLHLPQGSHFLWHIAIVMTAIYVGKSVDVMRDIPWDGEKKEDGEAAEDGTAQDAQTNTEEEPKSPPEEEAAPQE